MDTPVLSTLPGPSLEERNFCMGSRCKRKL